MHGRYTYARLTATGCPVPTKLGGREVVGKCAELLSGSASPSSARAVSTDRRHRRWLEGGTPTLGSPRRSGRYRLPWGRGGGRVRRTLRRARPLFPVVCGVRCLPADATPLPSVLDCYCFGERGRVARGHCRRGCIVPPTRLCTEGESAALDECRASGPDPRGVSVSTARCCPGLRRRGRCRP